MQSSAMTTKGQVTIPVAIRKKFGLQAGMKVSFSVQDNTIVIQPVPHRVEDVFGLVSAENSVSLDEMELIIRNRGRR